MSKVSTSFTKAIESFIEEEKTKNPDFLEATKKEDKNIDDCCNYILNKVQKLGHNGMADHEVFDIVTEYYFSEKIEKPKPVAAKVSVVKDTSFPIPKKVSEIKEQKPKPKTPSELLADEGITEEFLSTISAQTHGTKIILKAGMPVYSLLKSKDSFFVYDDKFQPVKNENGENMKISNKEGIIGIARFVLTNKK